MAGWKKLCTCVYVHVCVCACVSCKALMSSHPPSHSSRPQMKQGTLGGAWQRTPCVCKPAAAPFEHLGAGHGSKRARLGGRG
eukprot:1158084-Pelagomonas_calceolata.AAC.4